MSALYVVPAPGGDLGCPSWCVADHSGYGEQQRALGDLIHHESAAEGVDGFTVQVGGDSPEPFRARRVKLNRPDGTVLDEGWLIGEHAFSNAEALDMLEHLSDALERV